MSGFGPCEKSTAEYVRDYLSNDIFLKFAVPSTFVWGGSEYKNEKVITFCKEFGIEIFSIVKYHP